MKKHPFLQEVDCGMIYEYPPPFVPKLRDPLDTSYFDGIFNLKLEDMNLYALLC